MSTSKEVTLWCDAPDCPRWTYGDVPSTKSVRELRSNAKRRGWRYRDGNDYCPEHARSLSDEDGGGG